MIFIHFSDVVITRYGPVGAILTIPAIVYGRLISEPLKIAKGPPSFEQFRISYISVRQWNVVDIASIRRNS